MAGSRKTNPKVFLTEKRGVEEGAGMAQVEEDWAGLEMMIFTFLADVQNTKMSKYQVNMLVFETKSRKNVRDCRLENVNLQG